MGEKHAVGLVNITKLSLIVLYTVPLLPKVTLGQELQLLCFCSVSAVIALQLSKSKSQQEGK